MEGLGSFLLFAVLFYVMMRWGCGAHMMHGHGSSKRERPPSDSSDEVSHIDPVCGMEVKVDQGYGKMYESTLYRFCSKSCLDKFDNDPKLYLNKAKEN